jgi:hypothetical protein
MGRRDRRPTIPEESAMLLTGFSRPRSLFGMASEGPSSIPLLDDWIAGVGEDEVEAIIRAGLAEVENGTARDLIDKDAYAGWVAGQRQRSAS